MTSIKNILLIFSLFFVNIIYAECYELNQSDCDYWSQYCEWNDETGQCQEFGGGGGGGGDAADGPYQYATISESQGLRNGPDYRDGILYYPIDGNPPFNSVVITPGFGGGSSSMSSWGAFFASNGFTALIIGPNDEINDSHQQRGEGLIDGIETVRQENNRSASPLYGLIDTESFTVSGYSMGGGASHNAALMDSSIKAVISLNPTVLFENCDVCPEEDGYCICLVPEVIEHYIPSLIFAGEFEINELEAYAGLLGQDVYVNLPPETQKIMFEVAGGGHGSAYSPSGEVSDYILSFMNYYVIGDDSYCESLLETPSSTSQYLTNIECAASVVGDINNDSFVNVQDVILVVNLVLSLGYDASADMNSDGIINVLDIVQVVNIILE